MRVKIISDGTTMGTRVVDAETGEELRDVMGIEWGLEAGAIGVARVTLYKVPVEVIGEAPDDAGDGHQRLAFHDLLTATQVRRALKVSTSRVFQYIADGRLGYVETPLGRLYHREDVERLAEWRMGQLEERSA